MLWDEGEEPDASFLEACIACGGPPPIWEPVDGDDPDAGVFHCVRCDTVFDAEGDILSAPAYIHPMLQEDAEEDDEEEDEDEEGPS